MQSANKRKFGQSHLLEVLKNLAHVFLKILLEIFISKWPETQQLSVFKS